MAPSPPDSITRRPPTPDLIEPVWIDTADALRRRCTSWKKAPALAIDTEFVRTRTFFPRLGLIQVSDGNETCLIDPLAISSLETLEDVLQAPKVIKVLHSCGEDLEVFYHRFGTIPHPLFDTQIGAAFAGVGNSLGYSRLVHETFSVDLPKEETRSNWLKRPLTEAQMIYAALDVAYLLPLFHRLRKELQQLGRVDWMDQEIQQLSDPERFLPDPEEVFRKFAHPAMSPIELAALKALSAWREKEARQRDLPRNFVLPQKALIEIAKKRPSTQAQLEQLRILKPHELRRFSESVLGILHEVDKVPREELPEKIRRPRDLTPHRSQVERFRAALAKKAKKLGMAPELIANRKTAEAIWRRRIEGAQPVVPRAITPWRQRILAEVLDGLP